MKWSAGSSPSKGPKRLCKFCLLGVALPVLCLIVPVYVRFQVKTQEKFPLKCVFLNSLFSFQALKPYYFTLSPSDMKLLNHVRAQHVSKKIFYHFLTFNPGELPVDCVVPGPGAADELLLQRVPAAGAAEAEEDEAPRKDAEGDGAGGRHQGVLVQNSYFPTLLNSFLCYPINFTGASTSSAAPPCDCPSAPATRGPASSS